MMKNILVLIVMVSSMLTAYSQEDNADDINFLHKPWNEVIEIAKQENKLIFIDCYTSWCGPCKMLATKIFTQKKVADFYNANFICVKYDMEKGEGLKLVDKLKVKAYPTLLIYNGDGNEVHRKMGAGNAEEIISFGQEALDNKGFGGYAIRFAKGERSATFLQTYLIGLSNVGDVTTADAIARTLLNEQEKIDWNNASNWALIKAYLSDIYSDEEAYIRLHKADFQEVAGQGGFEDKWRQMYANQSFNLIVKKSNTEYEIDHTAFEAFSDVLDERNIPGKDELKLGVKIRAAGFSKDWNELVKQCDRAINYNFPAHEILNWASHIEQNCTDDIIRKKALVWVNHAAKLSDEERIKGWSNHLLEKL